jgi:GxxExxY protein
MSELIYKEESYKIVGLCMEVHRELGKGHNEAIYKDALEFELGQSHIPFARQKEFLIQYKTVILAHKYFADFVVLDKILLEAKAGEDSLNYKRVVL